MWVPLSDAAADPPGPLQAFGQVHRALRENEKRLSSVSGDLEKITVTIDEKVSRAARRIEQDGRRLRAETSDMCADLEELCLQIYEEHEAAIAEERATSEKLRAALEAEQAAHRAALTAQQGQIDALAAALRRQQELLDEHVGGTTAQMKAMQAEASELHRAFKAQGAAVQATKAFIGSVDEKLSAQITEHARAADGAAAAASTSWEARHAEHRAVLERILAWEPQLRTNEEAMRTWRVGVDEAILRSEQRGSAAVSAAQTILDAGRVEMAEAVSKASASVRELEQRWPDWVSELREQQATLSTRKANAAEVNERLDEVESRVASLARQYPLVVERVGHLEQPRAAQTAQMDEVARALTKASAELAEMRAASRHSQQQVGTLTTERQAQAASLASLETRMRQLGSMAEVSSTRHSHPRRTRTSRQPWLPSSVAHPLVVPQTWKCLTPVARVPAAQEHARYLVTLSDALHEKGVAAPKYRSAYIAQPRVAPGSLGAGVGGGASIALAPFAQEGAGAPRPAPATGGLDQDGATPYHAAELARGVDTEVRHEGMGEVVVSGGLL